ncbi:MAG: AMP-binding protein, partial [Smithellaceae bacterium]|nr:AMP-binding protein [Smithellaceae bacterium]
MGNVYLEKPWLKNYDQHVPPALRYEEKSFTELFSEIVARYPDKTALIYMGRSLTFRDVDVLSNQLAHFFIKNGLKPDDVVGLHMPNIPAHYIAALAAQKAGCI